jgi:type II secretory pathway predicted ATPase ExeA
VFKAFYGMTDNFFDKSAPVKYCFQSKDFKEMASRLRFVADTRGIAVFTSPSGGGKTYALRTFAESLNQNLHQMAYICLSTVSITQFYQQLCEALGLERLVSKSLMFSAIQKQLLAFYKSRKPLILVIDEAHELEPRILRDIKMIMNHGFDSINTFTLVFIAEPHFNNTLEKPVHESLRQRIIAHYNFEGLTADETAAYISHKLEAAGASANIIGEGVYSAIHGYSQGRPRLIDSLMTDILALGAQLGKLVVDTDIVLAAINNQALH